MWKETAEDQETKESKPDVRTNRENCKEEKAKPIRTEISGRNLTKGIRAVRRDINKDIEDIYRHRKARKPEKFSKTSLRSEEVPSLK